MSYSMINDLAESRMFPTKKSLDAQDFETLSETALMIIMMLRILLATNSYLAERYVDKTMSSGKNFIRWRADGTDLYHVLHCLHHGNYEEGHHPEKIELGPVVRWLWSVEKINRSQTDDTVLDLTETRRFFLRVERLFFIKNQSLKNIRRLVMDWEDLTQNQKQVSVTRLLQIMRSRAHNCDILSLFSKYASSHGWEKHDVCNPEEEDCGNYSEPKKKDPSPLWSMAGLATGFAAGYNAVRKKSVKESESGTTTSSNVASIATPLGGLGPGFAGEKGHKGIYQQPVIRRGEKPSK